VHPLLVATATRQGGVFSAAQAGAAGYATQEIQALLRAGTWRALRRGVYATATAVDQAVTPAQRHVLAAAAALVAVTGEAVASDKTAATLHGLDLLTPPAQVMATAPQLRSARRYPDLCVVPGRLPPTHAVRIGGLRATSLPRTVIDCARQGSFREGVVLADSALRGGRTRIEALEQVLCECHTWRGIRAAQRVVAFADPRTDAPSESVARVAFAEQGLPTPVPHVTLADDQGVIGTVDFYWREFRTVAEIDGKVKYLPDSDAPLRPAHDRLWREKLREDRLRDAGFHVVRITWWQLVQDPAGVAARIRRAFERSQRA
jgi:hypothetical protein